MRFLLLRKQRRKKIDPKLFPIVIRLSGSSEERARSLAAEFPDLQYLPSNASLDDAVSRIVELTRRASARKAV